MKDISDNERAVLEQLARHRKKQHRVVLRDLGNAVNLSIGTVWNALRRLEQLGLVKEAPVTVVEIGPAVTAAGKRALTERAA